MDCITLWTKGGLRKFSNLIISKEFLCYRIIKKTITEVCVLTCAVSACGGSLQLGMQPRDLLREIKLKERLESYCKVAERNTDVSMTFLRWIPYSEPFVHVCIHKEPGKEIILCTEAKSWHCSPTELVSSCLCSQSLSKIFKNWSVREVKTIF